LELLGCEAEALDEDGFGAVFFEAAGGAEFFEGGGGLLEEGWVGHVALVSGVEVSGDCEGEDH
jgi:hypothetical protein